MFSRIPRLPWSRSFAAAVCVSLLAAASPAHAGYDRTFPAGSLIIPTDLAYQDRGIFQAYGLVFQLLRHGITVYWVIDPAKTWHATDCDTAGDECAWDCAEEGSGVKCGYPTASPDFYVGATVVWDDQGTMNPGDTIVRHGYRGGPFLIDAADRARALPVIDAWNDPAEWTANPWAARTVFEVVTVHETTASFDGHVRKEMLAAPTIAVFSDGNEDIAASYLRAAGIPQSNGSEFPAARCNGNCGPGTANPDMLTVESVMGEMGTCDNPNLDHKNGALFTTDGIPAYCQIMSMHWNVDARERVECDGGGCPATQAECTGETFTYHGHEVVAEVRQFLQYPTHFFAECQAVNAYENTTPNPAWPFLDDAARDGHFLTTQGNPPGCPCSNGDFECVVGGCDNGARDCCLPKEPKELGAGFLIAAAPAANEIRILHPDIPYNQMDGAWAPEGGSEPAYNLSAYLGTAYKNDREVTFVTGVNGPGEQDVWMTGYVDGDCAIGNDDVQVIGQCDKGKVSYLGGHQYSTNLPLSSNPGGQGARVFLNALFEADCVTTVGQPNIQLSIDPSPTVAVPAFPAQVTFTATFSNAGRGTALDVSLTVAAATPLVVADHETGGTPSGNEVTWFHGSLGSTVGQPGDPSSQGARWITVTVDGPGSYDVTAQVDYRVGVTSLQTPLRVATITVGLDSDGDGIIDSEDPFPNNAFACGDADGDTCDDCSVAGSFAPANDGPDDDGDGLCNAGDPDPDPQAKKGGCGCTSGDPAGGIPVALALGLLLLYRRRRRRTCR